jgi:hypothetical protein
MVCERMPKRERKVTCPRCHRHVLEGALAEHMRTHKGKIPRHMRTPRAPLQQTQAPAGQVSNLGFKEFYKRHLSELPVRSALSKEQIHSKFEKALSDVDAKYKSLKLDPTHEPETIEVFIDEERNLTLKYHPALLATWTEEGVDALLLHEACHVVTLPNSLLRVPDTGTGMTNFLADYLTNYDEYLADAEFVRRFRQDARYGALRQHQISLFSNFDTIINAMRTMARLSYERNLQIDQFMVLQQLHSMVYDALFFFAAQDDSFSTWCKERGLEELHTFAKWIFEDFEHIRNLNLNHDETHRKVVISGTLSMSVNPLALMTVGKIAFAEGTKGLHEKSIQMKEYAGLVELWEKRRLMYG